MGEGEGALTHMPSVDALTQQRGCTQSGSDSCTTWVREEFEQSQQRCPGRLATSSVLVGCSIATPHPHHAHAHKTPTQCVPCSHMLQRCFAWAGCPYTTAHMCECAYPRVAQTSESRARW